MPRKKVKSQWEKVLPRGYLSPSAIELYAERCPRAYYYRYIEGIKDTRVSSLPVEGKATHKALEINNNHKLSTGDDLELDELLTAFGDTWSDMRKDINKWEDDDTPDKVQKRADAYLRKYRHYYAKRYIPTEGGVEKKVTGNIRGVPVLGYVDLEPEEDGFVRIVDYKVSRRSKSERDLTSSIQMGVYSILEDIHRIQYVNFVRTKDPQVKKIKGNQHSNHIKRVKNLTQSVAESIKKGNFPYTYPGHWMCSERFCGFWKLCPQGEG